MKKIIILGIAAMPFFFASCGGSEADAEGTDTDSTAVTEHVEEVETIVNNYAVDTVASVIKWSNYHGEEVDHAGTVGVLNGSFEVSTTGEVSTITSASLVVDMNSIQEESEKLVSHLKNEDFFDVNSFATTEFTFDRHEGDMIYGTLSVVGKELAVEAPASVTTDGDNASVSVGDFKLDFTSLEMPFFIEDVKAPAEEQHDPNIGFSAEIAGTVAH